MTTEEAAKEYFEHRFRALDGETQREEKLMCGIAYRVLRQKTENNAPLTLDELREMDGKPVYLAADNRWYIVNINYLTPCGARMSCGIDKWGQGTSLSLLAQCGMYRRKPGEGAEIGVAKDKDVPTK